MAAALTGSLDAPTPLRLIIASYSMLMVAERKRNMKKQAGKRFVEKWTGVFKGSSIEDWKDQKANDLQEKHK